MSNSHSVFISEERIRESNKRLGAHISHDYKDKEILLLVVLKGSFIFAADLAREITVPVTFEFIQVSSYYDDTKPSKIELVSTPGEKLRDKHVLIVEDIIDTTNTIRFLLDHVWSFEPKSVRICSLLHKPNGRKRHDAIHIDYCNFAIANYFVIGYGLDHAQKYRNLPYIARLE